MKRFFLIVMLLPMLFAPAVVATPNADADVDGRAVFAREALAGAESPACVPADDGRRVRNVTTASYRRISLVDDYLSALTYSGWGVAVSNERTRSLLRRGSPQWRQQWGGTLSYANTVNTAGRNMIQLLGVRYGWGAAYRMPAFARGLELWAGGVADADFMGKLIASSVNKPYSMDLAAGLNAAVWAGYTFPTRGRTVATLRYRVQVPVGGVMFVPEWGQAYYEMSLDLHLNRILHLSSLHNRLGLNQMLCVDLRLPRSSWRVGVEHEYLHYQANRMHFAREFVSVHVGWLSLLDIRRGTRR